MARTPFVGRGRALLVDGLLAAFDQVASERTPLWVSLEAPSGLGKTRVVHEFYERLARTRQSEPRYWPSHITGDAPEFDVEDIQVVRKQVAPSVKHTPRSLPAYVWWGIAASERQGVRRFALETDVLSLQQHGPYVDDAWRKIATWNQRHGDWWKKAFKAGRDEAITEAISEVMSAAIGLTVPGAGLLSDLVSLVRKQRADAKERASRLVGSELITDDSPRLALEISETITRIASVGLPVVIFVEDMHSADEAMTALLASLVGGAGAILIITTAWTGAGLGNEQLQNALAAAPERLVRVDSRELRSVPPFPDGGSLGPLDSVDAIEILRAAFPLVDPETARGLLGRYPNPLALMLFGSIRRLHTRFPDGRLHLSKEEILRMPATLHDLYRDLWRELPDEVRIELNLSSLASPATLSPSVIDARQWQRELIIQAAGDMLERPHEANLPLGTSETRAPELQDWASSAGEDLWKFLEPAQFEVAASEPDLVTDAERRLFYEAVARILVEKIREARWHSSPRRRYMVDLAAALWASDFVEWADYERALASYLRQVENDPEEAGGVLEAIEIFERCRSSRTGEQADPGSAGEAGALAWSAALAAVRLSRHERAATLLRQYVELGYPTTFSFRRERELSHALLAECEASRSPAEVAWEEVGDHLEQIRARVGDQHPITRVVAERIGGWHEGLPTAPSLLDAVRAGITRPIFTISDGPEYVVMNSITNNPKHGDERSFVLIRRVGDSTFTKEIALLRGAEYEVYTYFHNNAPYILNTESRGGVGIARGVRLALSAPSVVRPGERGRISSVLSVDNASPPRVWDQVYVTSASTVDLRFVTASAKIVSGGPVNGETLSSSLFTDQGTFLGYSELNGILPGGPDYAGYVLYRLKADFPAFTVKAEVAPRDSPNWAKQISVELGTLVRIRITYENIGTTDQSNVNLKSVLPGELSYVPGSTSLVNPSNPQGITVSDSITHQGISIGLYGPGAAAQVFFDAFVTHRPESSTTVSSSTSVITGNGTKSDVIGVTIV